MKLDYRILFTVFFQHSYFADNKLKALSIHVAQKSAIDLLRLGMLLKTFPGGFQVLYETNFGGKIRQRRDVLNGDTSLYFIVRNNDAAFFNYTSVVSADVSQMLFVFNSSSLPDGVLEVGSANLHDVNTCPANTCEINECRLKGYCRKSAGCPLHLYPEAFFNKPFAIITMKLEHSLIEEYYLRFTSKSTYWRYIVVSEHLQELTAPAVIHRSNLFSAQESAIRISNNTQAKLFMSHSPIELREQPDKGYRLVDNYNKDTGKYKNVIISTLPNPSIDNISALRELSDLDSGRDGNQDEKKLFSEIFI